MLLLTEKNSVRYCCTLAENTTTSKRKVVLACTVVCLFVHDIFKTAIGYKLTVITEQKNL